MVVKQLNKKKIVGICPVGMKKALCPSIKKTRQIHTQLMVLQRQKNADSAQIENLRQALKKRKSQGIAAECDTCIYNTR
ncbi:MAG: hypothetical protein E3K37_09080 [Candidatus Kuenenia sp.]|nr:hypothetical protein [Candidatus Kuenenia hertensis]